MNTLPDRETGSKKRSLLLTKMISRWDNEGGQIFSVSPVPLVDALPAKDIGLQSSMVDLNETRHHSIFLLIPSEFLKRSIEAEAALSGEAFDAGSAC